MSIRVMTAVWDHARVSGGTLIVLLAMADWANDDGTGVYPKQITLASKARMTDRNVRNCLTALEDAGYIKQAGKRGHTIDWTVEPDPEKIAERKPIAESTGSGLPTEPSTEPPEDKADASSSKVGDSDQYLKPATPGSAAAPWLAIELARLMRSNDPAAKLPVGLRELMAPEYLAQYPAGFVSPDKRRELIAPVVDKPALRKWLDAMRLLIDSDERGPKEAAKVLRWSQEDDFWKTNILSAPTFRKQYPKLRLRWLEEGGDGRSTAAPADRRPPDRGPATSAQLDAIAGRIT